MSIKIEKGVPIPPYNVGGAPCKYPWDEMDVGDSFFVPINLSSAVRASAQQRGKRRGEKYTTQTVTNDGVTGVRVWRVK